MDELVGHLQAFDQLLTNTLPEGRVHRSLRHLQDDRQRRDICGITQTGQLLKRLLCFGRQTSQLPEHEVHHVLGVPLGVNAADVPGPAALSVVEGEQTLGLESGQKLGREERIAARLVIDQLGERRDGVRATLNGILDQLRNVPLRKRSEPNVVDAGPCPANGLELSGQRMRSVDLVVAVRADDQQMLHIGLRQEVLERLERAGVEPLQIVQEERGWRPRPWEDADESTEHDLKTFSRVLWGKLRDRRLLTDDELQLRDEVHEELSVRVQRLSQRFAPGRQLGLALGQKTAEQTLEGLRQRGIRDVALVLLEFPGGKEAVGRDEDLVQLLDHGRFADAWVSGDEDQLG